MLALRRCPQHPDEPLLLHQTRTGLYWACEFNDCAHTEDFLPRTTGARALEVNGRPVASRIDKNRSGRRGGRR